MWCVCICVHLGDHENSLFLGICTARLGDHIEEAPLPVGSAIVTFAICEVLDALDCSPGTCNWTGDSEAAVTGNKKACGEGPHLPANARSHETQNCGRKVGQSATLGFGHKLNFISVYSCHFEHISADHSSPWQASVHVEISTVLQHSFSRSRSRIWSTTTRHRGSWTPHTDLSYWR